MNHDIYMRAVAAVSAVICLSCHVRTSAFDARCREFMPAGGTRRAAAMSKTRAQRSSALLLATSYSANTREVIHRARGDPSTHLSARRTSHPRKDKRKCENRTNRERNRRMRAAEKVSRTVIHEMISICARIRARALQRRAINCCYALNHAILLNPWD